MYKRQALLLSAVRLVPAQNLVDVPLDGLQLLEPLFLFVIGVIPVSYTHLDVYKRQGYIRYFSKMNGQVNAEVEEYVKQQLIAALFKFRFDR